MFVVDVKLFFVSLLRTGPGSLSGPMEHCRFLAQYARRQPATASAANILLRCSNGVIWRIIEIGS